MSKGWLTVVPLLALAVLGARPVHATAGAGSAGDALPAMPAIAPAAAATPGSHPHLMRPHGPGFDQPAAAQQSFACATNDLTVCLIGNRFEVTGNFTVLADSGPISGSAHMVKLTDDSAYMWFFTADNVEAVMKVLDGCALNSRYWFFAGGLTNVDVVITVTDSTTGDSKQFHNPQGTPFQPIQDTSALAVCP